MRTCAIAYAGFLTAFWVWTIIEVADGEPASPLLAIYALASGCLIGGPTGTTWRWAAQPRLTMSQAQMVTTWGLHRHERRAISRALRRGDPPPAGLEARALHYARAQHQLVPSGCLLLYMTAGSLPAVATDPHPGGWVWIQLGGATCTFVIGAGLLFWAGAITSTTHRWAAAMDL